MTLTAIDGTKTTLQSDQIPTLMEIALDPDAGPLTFVDPEVTQPRMSWFKSKILNFIEMISPSTGLQLRWAHTIAGQAILYEIYEGAQNIFDPTVIRYDAEAKANMVFLGFKFMGMLNT